MNAEFNWWLLIVGLVVGAGLVWLVVADSRRREVDITDREREGEAQWIADAMSGAGRPVDEGDVLDILRLHESYLTAAPPDETGEESAVPSAGWAAGPSGGPMAHRSEDRVVDPSSR